MSRDGILCAIRETAASNNGKPAGRNRFEQLTGITEYDIGRYWARWGDAVREAGFDANVLNEAFSDEHVLEKFVDLVVRLGRIPTNSEMRLERHAHDPTFPNVAVFGRFGPKADLLARARSYCRDTGYAPEVLPILGRSPGSGGITANPSADPVGADTEYGYVHLAQGHRHEYKIGRTNLVDRRVSEIGATASVELQLVHEIKTDDPIGVEAYWHRRFSDKRMRGEWFKLSAADVRAFRRWKRIY